MTALAIDPCITPTGDLLIAPTAFTHTHRGNRPEGGDKFIATSWILFQRAETLFATTPSAVRRDASPSSSPAP